MAGGDKASFLNVDKSTTFTVQFNPKEFTLEEASSWKASDEFQKTTPQMHYNRNKPATIKMDLIFDTTDSGEDVHKLWVQNMRSFLSAEQKDKVPENHELKRPPLLQFNWGKMQFDCICESLTSQFLMFKADGTPLRAKVSITLKSRRKNYETASSNVDPLKAMESMMSDTGTAKEKGDAEEIKKKTGKGGHKSSSDFTKEYKSKPNDSISDVANATGTDVKLIAAANGLNPLDPAPPIVVIPSSAAVAAIFEHLNKSSAPAAWGDVTPNLNPDSAPGDDWSIDKGDYEHGLSEGQIEFSNYSSETTYGEENEAVFSDAYGGETELNDYTQGDSNLADGWSTDANGGIEHEYGAENEASFSDSYGGETEVNEYSQGDSQTSDGMDTAANSGVEHTYGKENQAEFSEKGDGSVDPTEYSAAEGSSSDDMDISKNEGVEHSAGKENEASFSDTKSGETQANEMSHGDSSSAAGESGGANEAGGAAGSKQEAATSGGGAAGGKQEAAASGSGATGGQEAGTSGDSAAPGASGDSATSSAGAKAADSAGDTASGSNAGTAGAAGDSAAPGTDAATDAAANSAASDATEQAAAQAAGNAEATTQAEAAAGGAKTSDIASETSRSDDRTDFSPGSNPGDSTRTQATREVDQAVAGAEGVAKEVDSAVKAPGQAQKDLTNQAKTIAAKAEMHADRITGETTEATD